MNERRVVIPASGISHQVIPHPAVVGSEPLCPTWCASHDESGELRYSDGCTWQEITEEDVPIFGDEVIG